MNRPTPDQQAGSAMRSFWSSVTVAATALILSALVLGLPHHVSTVLTRQLLPRGMVLVVLGPCPSGWRRYAAADQRYLIAADGNVLIPGAVGGGTRSGTDDPSVPRSTGEIIHRPPAINPTPGPESMTPLAPTPPYVAINLCQIA